MPLRFVRGDATAPVGEGPRTLVHVCNDRGGWGRGFVFAISKRWPEPERAYRGWARSGDPDASFALGEVQFVDVGADLFVANLIGQHGTRPKGARPPVRYEAIERGLGVVAEDALARGASVHMPRIGCGLAGGRWEEVAPLLERTLLRAGLEVVVYDWP